MINPIASDNILIGIEKPVGLSARNCVPAKIGKIEDTGSRLLVHAIVSDSLPNFVVEITLDAVEALSLEAGKSVFLIFKILGRGPFLDGLLKVGVQIQIWMDFHGFGGFQGVDSAAPTVCAVHVASYIGCLCVVMRHY